MCGEEKRKGHSQKRLGGKAPYVLLPLEVLEAVHLSHVKNSGRVSFLLQEVCLYKQTLKPVVF